MAMDTAHPENAVTPLTDESFSPVKQTTEDMEHRLGSLSDKITLCNRVLDDLKDLSDVLVRRSLQDVALLPQK